MAVPVEVNGKTVYAQFGLTKGGEGKEPKKGNYILDSLVM